MGRPDFLEFQDATDRRAGADRQREHGRGRLSSRPGRLEAPSVRQADERKAAKAEEPREDRLGKQDEEDHRDR